MSLTLDQLKAAFKKNENTGENRPNNYYPFWNMQVGEQAVIRFLPDKNPDNHLGFMVEKMTHVLAINGENKTVPCLKMYDEDCPICKVSSAYYKEEGKGSPNGKKYWRKKQHVAQALVLEDPLPPDAETHETHEGKVRFIALGYQLFNVIKEAFEGGELEDVPFSYDGGYNFVIKKTQQGQYSTYAMGSRFKAKPQTLDPEVIAAVEDEMVDLSSLLPAHPGLDKVEAMLEAALTGAEYGNTGSGDAPKSTAKSLDDDDDDVPPFEATKAKPAPAKKAIAEDNDMDNEADKILEQIRARRSKA